MLTIQCVHESMLSMQGINPHFPYNVKIYMLALQSVNPHAHLKTA